MMSALNCKASDRGFKRTEILAWSDNNVKPRLNEVRIEDFEFEVIVSQVRGE
jgi:hypothetical protein